MVLVLVVGGNRDGDGDAEQRLKVCGGRAFFSGCVNGTGRTRVSDSWLYIHPSHSSVDGLGTGCRMRGSTNGKHPSDEGQGCAGRGLTCKSKVRIQDLGG